MASNNEHSGHRIRLRDRVRKEGLDNFQNYQVLEYVLTFSIPYKDTNVLAHRLINKFGSFHGVLEADEEDLKMVEGMGDVTAHFLSNLLKIYSFYEQDKAKQISTVINPEQSYSYVKQFLVGKLVEELYVVCLTANNKIVSVEKISEGTSGEAKVSIKAITDKMSRAKVSNIIVAHNHPKGLAEPSLDDDNFTKALVTAVSLHGSHLLDHIIIGDGGEYYSYRRSGLIDKYRDSAAALVGYRYVSQPMARYEVDDDKK